MPRVSGQVRQKGSGAGIGMPQCYLLPLFSSLLFFLFFFFPLFSALSLSLFFSPFLLLFFLFSYLLLSYRIFCPLASFSFLFSSFAALRGYYLVVAYPNDF
jgi:hypothetical protein